MTDAWNIVCSKCGAADTVPFAPKPDKPVLCRNCFQAKGQAQPSAQAPPGAALQPVPVTNGRDEIMARMSAFRGLCELGVMAQVSYKDGLLQVFMDIEDVTNYLLTGNSEILAKVEQRFKLTMKKAAVK